ncbi:MAG: sugar ABC transporter ATP-binding protein [Acetanaerobacterium sp.]
MSENPILLECRNVCKSFSKNKVLQNINLSIKRGEVHALLGQNGAGKSTFVKILTGVYTRDSGEILFNGEPVKLQTPQDAERLGIAIIHQDQQMVPFFDVTRNAYLGLEIKKKSGALDFKRMRELVVDKLKFINADFTADQQILTLTVGQREQVAIVAALLQNPKLLILDEPTASLSNTEIERLFEIIKMLRDSGVTVIYISHHLDEVFRITDSITVLRDSYNQGTLLTKEVTHEQIVTMMIGRELKEFYPKEPAEIGDVLLEVNDLHQGKMVNGVSFSLRKGEILGLAGLVGAGRTESMLAIYGAEKKKSGSMKIGGRHYEPQSPLNARKNGIAFIPEDRRNEGIVANMDISQNLSLANTHLWSKNGIINRLLERTHSSSIINALNIVCTDCKQLVGELSGGNQQKVVIGRWMTGDAKIFIFDQPTTGVDVGAKTEIYKQMVQLAQRGCGIIFISSENEELLGICDRIAVMSKGRVVKEFDASNASEQELLSWSSSAQITNEAVGGVLQ